MNEAIVIDEPTRPEAHAPYGRIFLYLLLLTVAEYLYALASSRFGLGFAVLLAGLLAMALTKAALVGLYFMHIKYEGRWVFALIVPTLFMAAVFVVGVFPDIGVPPEETAALKERPDGVVPPPVAGASTSRPSAP